MIRLQNLTKEYTSKTGATKAVDGIDLTIADGEFVALLGPSGCGKTTTLMMIAGLLKPTAGEIYFGEKPVTMLAPKARNIGMVFQSYALYPHLKVRGNIGFPLVEKKMKKQLTDEKVEAVAAKLQIQHLLERKPHELSGGQQQRVAMARALVKEPDILLLDEPMSNLDARLKLEVRDEIRKIQQDIGVTTIIVTHDQEEALAISDKVAILDMGKIQQYDVPDALYNDPGNLFTANFLGNPPMNILEGSIVRKGGDSWFLFPGCLFPIDGAPFAREYKSARIGVRPSDIAVDASSPIRASVLLVEHTGKEKLVKLEMKGSGYHFRMQAPQDLSIRRGEEIGVRFRADRSYFFDEGEAGARIRRAM